MTNNNSCRKKIILNGNITKVGYYLEIDKQYSSPLLDKENLEKEILIFLNNGYNSNQIEIKVIPL